MGVDVRLAKLITAQPKKHPYTGADSFPENTQPDKQLAAQPAFNLAAPKYIPRPCCAPSARALCAVVVAEHSLHHR